jgi:hypothetical protein
MLAASRGMNFGAPIGEKSSASERYREGASAISI